jgi:flagellar biosynthetic protein FlhB
MAEEPRGEKTLPASGSKRDKARREGNIAKSQDLSAAISLGGALFALLVLGPYTFDWLVESTRHFIGEAAGLTPDRTPPHTIAIDATMWYAVTVLPFMGIMLVLGLISSFLQVGFLITTTPLQPKLNRLNPITGMRKFVSLRSLFELAKSIAKLVIVGTVVWLYLRDKRELFVALMVVPPSGMSPAVGSIIFGVWWRIALSMAVLGILDYGYQYWQREQDLRMTAEEAKQESKELEGDPQVKRRIRQLQRQMSQQRMMKEVPKADVIITNPTTYAVALRYDMETMTAPMVTAKGMRVVAERIRTLAIENGVPIVQRPELARTLYRTLEPGQAISEDLFRAVAEVLAFVYRIDRREEKQVERRVAV